MGDRDGAPAPLPEPGPVCDIEPGDAVRIRTSILSDRSTRMAPKELWKIGHPNFFLVNSVFVHKGIVCVRLAECCGWWEDPKKRPSSEILCDGHPVDWFEKTEYVPRKEDKFLDVVTPFGPVLEFAYKTRERNPGLFLKLFGKWQFSMLGEFTKMVAKPLQDRGFL